MTAASRRIREISFSQIEASTIEPLIRNEPVVVVTLNDLTDSLDQKFISVIRAILKYRRTCVFTASGWDADPRPISEIPEARRVFNLAATEYGVLGLIKDKIRLGIQPVAVGGLALEQEIDEFVACCIGQYVYHAELGKSVFIIDPNQKARLIDASVESYTRLYRDLL